MSIGSVVVLARKWLGKLTDVLLAGRKLGWWQKKDEPWK